MSIVALEISVSMFCNVGEASLKDVPPIDPQMKSIASHHFSTIASSVLITYSKPTRQCSVTGAVAVSTRCHVSKCPLGSWLTRMP